MPIMFDGDSTLHQIACDKMRRQLPDGAWMKEADSDEFTWKGLNCRMLRNPVTFSWCGYAGVPRGYMMFELPYGKHEIELYRVIKKARTLPLECLDKGLQTIVALTSNTEMVPTPEGILEVHGGITWSDIGPSGDWEYGFDCAHAWDHCPGLEYQLDSAFALSGKKRPKKLFGDEKIYRDQRFAREDVYRLAEQLQAIEDFYREMKNES